MAFHTNFSHQQPCLEVMGPEGEPLTTNQCPGEFSLAPRQVARASPLTKFPYFLCAVPPCGLEVKSLVLRA